MCWMYSKRTRENCTQRRSQVVGKRMQGFGQWMNSSIIHDCICSLIHLKCHPKSYHSDIEFRMTLNIVFEEDSLWPLPKMLASEAATSPPQRLRVRVWGSLVQHERDLRLGTHVNWPLFSFKLLLVRVDGIQQFYHG